MVQTIALRSYFAVAEANTYIKICNGFLALINLWLITNKEFHLPPKAAKQLFRNNYRRVEFSNLRAAEKQRTKEKKNWRVKSRLRRTLSPPTTTTTLSILCGKQRQKEFTSLTFRWRREAKEIHFSLIGHQEVFESEKWRTKYLASVFRNTIRKLRRLNTKEMKVGRQNLSSGVFAHEVVGKRRNEI